MVWNHRKRLVSLCTILGFLISLWSFRVQAQSGDEGWSLPVALSENPSATWYSRDPGRLISDPPAGGMRVPAILADPSGALHVFWADWGDPISGEGARTIFYTHWDGTSWSKPISVLAIGDENEAFAVALDATGMLHTLWRSAGLIYYSRALAREAGSARVWQPPVPLFESTGSNITYPCDIVADPAGVLHAIYIDWPATNDGGIVTAQPGRAAWGCRKYG